MAFKLSIEFHGTVALVPSADNDSVPAMRMLLGRFQNINGVKDQVPYVRFHPRNKGKANVRLVSPLPASAPEGVKGTLAHFVLNDEFLRLDIPDVVNGQLTVIDGHDVRFDRPTAADDKSVHWLPHLDRINPGSEVIDPTLLDRLAPPTGRLAARIDVTHGRLETSGTSAQQVTFAGAGGTPALRQSIARDSVLTIDVPGDHFILRSEPLRLQAEAPLIISDRAGGSAGRDRSLDMIFEANGDDVIELVIGNEPEEDIFMPPQPLEISDKPANEFGLFYRLSAAPGPSPVLPLGRSRGGNEQLCANAVFAKP